MKKILTITLIVLVVTLPSANAFTLFGIDFGTLWDKITFWNNNKDQKNTGTPTTNTQKTTQTNNNNQIPTKPKPEIYITLAGKNYTQSNLKNTFSSDEQLQGYVKGFNYKCIYIETDKGTKFTLNFNTESGTLNSLSKGNNCPDKEIYIEESLITDISENGFNAKEIKTYLEKVDLPWTMYAKAIKVFTVG